MARFRSERGLDSRQHKFVFKNKLVSLDSTISLCLALFPWARFRQAKGGVKAPVLLSYDDYMPEYVILTEARCRDVKMARSFSFNPGTIVTLDRGYADYKLFARWTEEGLFRHAIERQRRLRGGRGMRGSAKPGNRLGQPHSLQRRQGQRGLSLPAAACRGVGCRQRARNRPADQPSRVRCCHNRRYLPRPLEN